MNHLAQLNIANLRYPIDHPEISEFVNNLDRINSLAEKSHGFVWRLTEDSSGHDVQFFNAVDTIANMSVWESMEDLISFTYKSQHSDIMKKRNQWFKKMDGAHYVLWWIKKGHIPNLEEAKERLENLNKDGASPFAFNFQNMFDPPE